MTTPTPDEIVEGITGILRAYDLRASVNSCLTDDKYAEAVAKYLLSSEPLRGLLAECLEIAMNVPAEIVHPSRTGALIATLRALGGEAKAG